MKDLDYFLELWHAKSSGVEHSPELWNERAGEWIAEPSRLSAGRAERVCGILADRGVLNADTSVIDVGCGPGIFVEEFAKYCKHATGVDFSSKFIEFALSRKSANTNFIRANFSEFDAGTKYDLAFASNSPAIYNLSALEKFESLSNAWCCNTVFVKSPGRFGQGFYSLINILWHRGFLPETRYFRIGEEIFGMVLWNAAEKRD
jgi:SAM-dependent methyltransferase